MVGERVPPGLRVGESDAVVHAVRLGDSELDPLADVERDGKAENESIDLVELALRAPLLLGLSDAEGERDSVDVRDGNGVVDSAPDADGLVDGERDAAGECVLDTEGASETVVISDAEVELLELRDPEPVAERHNDALAEGERVGDRVADPERLLLKDTLLVRDVNCVDEPTREGEPVALLLRDADAAAESLAERLTDGLRVGDNDAEADRDAMGDAVKDGEPDELRLGTSDTDARVPDASELTETLGDRLRLARLEALKDSVTLGDPVELTDADAAPLAELEKLAIDAEGDSDASDEADELPLADGSVDGDKLPDGDKDGSCDADATDAVIERVAMGVADAWVTDADADKQSDTLAVHDARLFDAAAEREGLKLPLGERLKLSVADGEKVSEGLPLWLSHALALPEAALDSELLPDGERLGVGLALPERVPDPERDADEDLEGDTVALRKREGDDDRDLDSEPDGTCERDGICV